MGLYNKHYFESNIMIQIATYFSIPIKVNNLIYPPLIPENRKKQILANSIVIDTSSSSWFMEHFDVSIEIWEGWEALGSCYYGYG